MHDEPAGCFCQFLSPPVVVKQGLDRIGISGTIIFRCQ